MRLPGANYAYGVKSLGRVGNEAARVQSAHAEEVLTTQTAKNAVIKEFQNSIDAVATWDEATQTANANAALADYSEAMTQQQVTLAATKQWSVKDVPEGVQVERERNGEPVDFVPSWQVAPQMYDLAEKTASERALAKVTNPAIKEKLRVQLQNERTQGAAKVSATYFQDRMDSIRNTTAEALQKAVLAENTALGEKILADAVETGAFSLDEARQQRQQMLEDTDEVRASRFLSETDDPAKLEAFAAGIGAEGPNTQFPHLTPAKRVALMNTAESRAITLTNQRLAQYDRAKSNAAEATFNSVLERFTMTGQGATPAEISAAKNYMSPSQFKSFVGIGRTGNANGMPSDPNTVRTLQGAVATVVGGTTPLNGATDLETKLAILRDANEQAFAAGTVNPTDYTAINKMIDDTGNNVFGSDGFKNASETIKKGIAPNVGVPGLPTPKTDARIEQQAQMELRAAVSANPKLDPVKWAQENLPRFQYQVNDDLNVTLTELGVGSMIVTNPDGTIDKVKSEAALRSLAAGKGLSLDVLEEAVNKLNRATP
jgi:hypothetical protein